MADVEARRSSLPACLDTTWRELGLHAVPNPSRHLHSLDVSRLFFPYLLRHDFAALADLSAASNGHLHLS